MWLINTNDLSLKSFHRSPAYAILSHTWSTDDNDELSFDEFKAGQGRHKTGFGKIRMCCDQAKKDGIEWAWVDTCCIDKRNNTELSEAINSMFNWYRDAKICYVYLADVYTHRPLDLTDHFWFTRLKTSRWFTRGWTLQELIAPEEVCFYDHGWYRLGTKRDLAEEIQAITGIMVEVLTSRRSFQDCSIAQRMSWASRRETTRVEDIAYCLIGLFDVNIPMLYGEGPKAFIRLQEEIIRQTDDETIFIWSGVSDDGDGLLAPSPSNFIDSASIRSKRYYTYGHEPHSMTPRGLSMQCRLLPIEMNTYLAIMQCVQEMPNLTTEQVGIFLCRTADDLQYQRVTLKGKCWKIVTSLPTSKAITSRISVRNRGGALRIMPRDGWPQILVHSDLHAWHFPAYDFDQPSGGLFARMTDLELQAAYGMAFRFRRDPSEPWMIPVQGVSESHTALQEYEGLLSHLWPPYRWSPKEVRQIQFLPRDLERGIVIAFTRLADSATTFYYHLEVGFDRDFNPTCILHAEQFRLVPLYRWETLGKIIYGTPAMLLRIATGLILTVCHLIRINLLPRALSTFEAFWSSGTCRCQRQKDGAITVTRELCHACYTGVNRGSRPRVRRLRTLWNPTQRARKQKDSFMRRLEGSRVEGFKFSTAADTTLSSPCTELELNFEPLGGLDWRLTFLETRIHSSKWQYHGFCLECVYRSLDVALPYATTTILVFSLPLFLTAIVCSERVSGALGLGMSNCYAIAFFIFYSPWYWILAYLLVLAVQRAHFEDGILSRYTILLSGFFGVLPSIAVAGMSWYNICLVAVQVVGLGLVAYVDGDDVVSGAM